MLPSFLLIAALASHVLPHPWWNFTAVGGALLVWGARRPVWTAILPVALLAGADWYLTRFVYSYDFHVSAYVVTWLWYAYAILLGRLFLRGQPGFARVIGAGVLSSTSFFLASNYAVWAMPGSWYPHTPVGLETCFAAALPFYRNDLFSTLLIVGLVFGLPVLLVLTRLRSLVGDLRP